MKSLNVNLENCYGITKLKYDFQFNNKNTYLIYASNGLMKTSFTKTIDAIINGRQPEEELFGLTPNYSVQDENGNSINDQNTFVVKSYDESYSSKNVSTLLMNETLKQEYDKVTKEIIDAKNEFVNKIDISFPKGSNFESEFNRVFETENMLETLEKLVDNGVGTSYPIDFSKIGYGDLFNDKVKEFVDKNSKELIEYKNEYESLIGNCKYYSRGVFSQYNADNIGESLKENGFFDAGHKILLNDNKELVSADEYYELFENEKKKVFGDAKLLRKFAKIDKSLSKNTQLRNFRKTIENNLELILDIVPFSLFERNCWNKIINNNLEDVKKLIEKYKNSKNDIKHLQEEANKQNENWENVIRIFTERFHVPFSVSIGNQEDVILHNSVPIFEFTYSDKLQINTAIVERSKLNSVLSGGEKRALYLMNVIFELEALKKEGKEYLIVCDDIAESFDYKNKHAIVEYLYENSQYNNFKFIILTHNFDFYRTIASRLLSYDRNHSLMARFNYDDNSIYLDKGKYQRNVFDYWHQNYNGNNAIILALIPFMRNIIEYTKSNIDTDYLKLTSLLHYKIDNSSKTNNIKMNELNTIMKKVWCDIDILTTYNEDDCVYNKIIDEAKSISSTQDNGTLDLERKIVLSMACRLLGEKIIIEKLLDNGVLSSDISSITKNQTGELVKLYEDRFGTNNDFYKIVRQITLLTSENIHLNSFMYEPLIDTSPNELKSLFGQLITIGDDNNIINETV